LIYLKGLTTSQIYTYNQRFAGKSLIIGDSAEPRLIEELRQKGNNIKGAIKGKDSIIYGITLMQDYDLVIDPDSINLIKELNNYTWLSKKSNTPIDNHNHIIDAIRYSLSYQLINKNKGKYSISSIN